MQLNLLAGEADRDQGIALVELHGAEFLREMRWYAEVVCRRFGTVTSDQLRGYAEGRGIKPHSKNCWGAIFREARWRSVGWTRSAKRTNHARAIRVWELRDAI